jgi:hypothetical protein
MPASSKAQQKFMGIVHSLQKGDIKPSDVSKSVKDAAKSMSKKDAKDFASTPHKGLPKKVKLEIVKRLKEYANKMGLDHLGGDSIPSNKKRGGLRDFDGYDNVDYNKDMPMDEAYIVLHSPKKGQKPVATAAYRDKKDAQKWEKDLKKKKGGITMIVQKKVKGVDESVVKEAGMIPKLYSAFVGLKFKVKGLEEDQLKMLKQFKSEKDTNKKKALLDKMKKATVVLKKQRGYLSNLEADWLNKLDTVIKELAVTEGGLPQNWMAGRVSDYHTKLRGKKRKYDDTNFAKTNTGQPDIPEEEKDDEIVNETKPLLKKVKLEIVKRLKEYASRLSNAYILDDESILKGTPEPKDAIKREVSEASIKGKNNKTGESFGMVIGSDKEGTDGFDVTIRKSYSSRISSYKFSFNKDSNLTHLKDYGYSMDGKFPDLKGNGSVVRIRPSKRETITQIAKVTSPAFAKKIYQHVQKVNTLKESVDKGDLKNAKFRLSKVLKYLDIEYKKTRRGEKYVQIHYIPVTRPQSQNPEWVNVRYEDEKDLQKIGKALKLKLKESVTEETKRDYKDEYKKFQSSTKSKKYRAELNKYNRDKGTYGNGDGKDASHKGGKIVGFEKESVNRSRKEKSRLKK